MSVNSELHSNETFTIQYLAMSVHRKPSTNLTVTHLDVSQREIENVSGIIFFLKKHQDDPFITFIFETGHHGGFLGRGNKMAKIYKKENTQ